MLKGTKIRREASLYDYVYSEEAPYQIISNESLSIKDVEEIHLVEHMLDIYHNKGYFGKNTHNYILNTKDPYNFFKLIGEFYLINKYSFKGYQVEDVYSRLFNFIEDNEVIFTLKQDYLNRSKIKPKIFWEQDISKQEKNVILKEIALKSKITINSLYKHTAIIKFENIYYVVFYKDYNNYGFTIYK